MEVLGAMYNYGSTLRFARRFEEAEAQLRLAHDGYVDRLGADGYPVLVVRDEMAWLARDLDPGLGSEAFGELAADGLRVIGPCHGMTLNWTRQRVILLIEAGRFEDARELLARMVSAVDGHVAASEQDRRLREYLSIYQRLDDTDPDGGHQAELRELRTRLESASSD